MWSIDITIIIVAVLQNAEVTVVVLQPQENYLGSLPVFLGFIP